MTDAFNHNDLQVCDKFYSVQGTNPTFNRKKIHQVIDGQDWFRYEAPLKVYNIKEHEVLGILHKTLEGDWKPDENYSLVNEFFIRLSDYDSVLKQYHYYTDDFSYSSSKMFSNVEDAKEHLENLKRETREMDLS